MSTSETLAHFFKPETRAAGQELASEGAVSLTIAGDERVEAFIRKSSPVKVKFTTSSIADPVFQVECSCPAAGRGQLCKHIWATLLKVEEKNPDFLDSKKDLERAPAQSEGLSPKAKPVSAANTAYQDAMKERQASYRKEQYQKQKARHKEQKRGRNGEDRASAAPRSISPEIDAALAYFKQNGFDFEFPVPLDELNKAKKLLSRIFHPDKGGTHEEILSLNQNFETLAAAGR